MKMMTLKRKNKLYAEHWKLAWIMVAIGASFYAYEFITRLTPSLAIPTLMHHFNVSTGEIGKIIAFYYFIYTPLQLVVGILMDRYGPKRLLTIACLACAVGNFLFVSTHIVIIAEAARLLMGAGSAFAYVGALKLATLWLPQRHFGLATGVVNTVSMLLAAVSEEILPPIIHHVGWLTAMNTISVIGGVLCLVIWLVVKDGYQQHSTDSSIELMNYRPLLLGLRSALSKPQMWITGFVGFCLFSTVSIFPVSWGTLFLTQAKHFSLNQAAIIASCILWGFAIGSLVIGKLSDVFYSRSIILKITPLLALILTSIILYLPAFSFGWMLVLFFALGFVSSGEIMVFTMAIELNSLKISGISVSLMNLFVMLNAIILLPTIGYLLDFFNPSNLTAKTIYLNSSFKSALSILPILLALSFIASLFLKEPKHDPRVKKTTIAH